MIRVKEGGDRKEDVFELTKLKVKENDKNKMFASVKSTAPKRLSK